ncbi:protein LTO1 homolog isoform X1 [Eptesicus fuscus]|uniref:protein LTO1 homolog isoform X1 n=1 Tax=Eptesicus fuscus TaxID=29078 RepID=UPI00240417B0|nr:protein LTO1 homolog isoform X1 [Eptesicus fuscus]
MAEGQDLFDAIVMADDRFRGEGYQEGYEEGSGLGIIEGRQHGTVYGAKIGSEIGCYQGFAFAWRCLLHSCATEKDRAGSGDLWTWRRGEASWTSGAGRARCSRSGGALQHSKWLRGSVLNWRQSDGLCWVHPHVQDTAVLWVGVLMFVSRTGYHAQGEARASPP